MSAVSLYRPPRSLRGWVLISWSRRYTFTTSHRRGPSPAPRRPATARNTAPGHCSGNRRDFTSAQYGTWYRSAGAGSKHGASRAANTTAGTCRGAVHPRVRHPSQAPIFDRASASSSKLSPAKNSPRISRRPDPGLVRDAVPGGSVTNPRAWALQPLAGQPRFDRVRVRDDRALLSGTTTRNTPEKNSQPSSSRRRPPPASSRTSGTRTCTGKSTREHQRPRLRRRPSRPGSAPDPRNRPAAHRPAARHRPACSPSCRRTARPRTGAAPLRHHHALPPQQDADLDHRHPPFTHAAIPHGGPPLRPAPAVPVRAHRPPTDTTCPIAHRELLLPPPRDRPAATAALTTVCSSCGPRSLRGHRPLPCPRARPAHLTDSILTPPEHHPGDLQSLDWEDQTGTHRTSGAPRRWSSYWRRVVPCHGGKP